MRIRSVFVSARGFPQSQYDGGGGSPNLRTRRNEVTEDVDSGRVDVPEIGQIENYGTGNRETLPLQPGHIPYMKPSVDMYDRHARVGRLANPNYHGQAPLTQH